MKPRLNNPHGGLLRRLHQDDSGQIVPLFIFGALTLVFVVLLILNTGRQTQQRIEVQNAADAAVMTQASWVARSLNIISLNNTAITQAFATAALATAWSDFKQLMPGNAYQRMAFRSMRMVHSLEAMNRKLVDNFSSFSAMLALDLAGKNGMSDAPVFYAGYDHPRYSDGMRGAPSTRYYSTPLPVVATVDSPPYLCLSGELGTLSAPMPYLNYNFQQYGYPLDQGPFVTGRRHLLNRIPILLFLKRIEFRSNADDLWADRCSQSGLVLFEVANPPEPFGPLGEARDNWSIIAFTRSNEQRMVLPAKFPNPAGAYFGFAQAEIYNAANYDLYSQDWHARLVPARLLSGARRSAVLQAIAPPSSRGGFAPLYSLLSAINPDDMEQYIAH